MMDFTIFFYTVVDGCTRSTWVFLLRHKVEQFSTLSFFLPWFLLNFNERLKYVILSDNGIEFLNSSTKKLFNATSIIHQTSCAHTPKKQSYRVTAHTSTLSSSFPKITRCYSFKILGLLCVDNLLCDKCYTFVFAP